MHHLLVIFPISPSGSVLWFFTISSHLPAPPLCFVFHETFSSQRPPAAAAASQELFSPC